MQGDAKFVVYAAVDVPAEYSDRVLFRPNANVPGGVEPFVPQLGEDKEVCQFSVEVPSKPIKEAHFREIFRKMGEACLERARAAGLVIP